MSRRRDSAPHQERDRLKVYALAGLAALLPGCVVPTATWKGKVEWPDDYSGRNIVPFMEAGAALAAAAAIREMIRTNPHPHLFQGCSSPEQGLEVAVHRGPTSGLYYVMLEERFDRCGGPRYRVLDWWYVYAVTPQGEVVAEAPQPQWTWEDAEVAPPSSSEQALPPAEPPPPPEAPSPPPAVPSPESQPPLPSAPDAPEPTGRSR
jgi:hypothetical protein